MPAARIVYGGVFPTYHWRDILRDEPYVTAIVRGEGEETARALMRALQYGQRPRRIRRHRLSRPWPAARDAAGARDLGSRRLPGRLGTDRSRALFLLGRPARRGRAVLARLPASLQLLRPARLLDALAPPRSRPLRQGAGAAASRARRQGDQFRGRESDRVEEGLAVLSRGPDRRERRSDPGRIDPRRRYRARRRYPASLQEGRLGALPARPGEHRRADAGTDPQGRRRRRPIARRSA